MTAGDDTQTAPESSRLWWAAPSAGLLLLISLAMLVGGTPPPPPGHNSYDAGPGGFRAAYLLLEELRYPVVRSRRPAGGAVRFVFSPHPETRPGALAAWVRDGGRLLLADPSASYAANFGVAVRSVSDDASPRLLLEVKGVPDVRTLALERSRRVGTAGREDDSAGRFETRPGPSQVEPVTSGGRTWGEAGGRPLITVFPHGRGEIWLLRRPGAFTNEAMRQADNGILLARLADAMMQGRPGDLSFDEFVHGLRDSPGVTELLFEPPMLFFSLAALLFTAILVWHHAPRFGRQTADRPQRRRSKEEFLDAMAELLDRKSDYPDAYATVRRRVLREIEAALGLPTGTPLKELFVEVEHRRPGSLAAVRRALERDTVPGGSRAGFVTALNHLEAAYDEFSQRRPAR